MTYISRQELFDNAWNGFVKQGWKRSIVYEEGIASCAYRGGDNCRCAIGWSIPDAVYKPTFEGKIGNHPIIIVAVNADRTDKVTYNPDPNDVEDEYSFVHALQLVHDLASNADGVLEAWMRRFARTMSLTIPGE